MKDDIKQNEPFDAEEEQKSYDDYRKSERYVKHKNEEILVDYKINIEVIKKS